MATTQPGAIDVATNLFTVTNRATTSLASSITSGDTSISVSDGSVFPSSGRFKITIGNEIIDIASRSGTTLTAEARGVEGTTAASHFSGDAVAMNLTAGHYETLRDAIIATQEGAMRRPSAASASTGITVHGPATDPFLNSRRFAI